MSLGNSIPKRKTYTSAPAITIDKNKKYTASMETNKGTMVLDLFVSDAPRTVNNFVCLSRDGFYDGTIFHRVIADFMAQGGDPTGTGRGGPGYQFPDEFSKRTHIAGSLSMANAGPGTNGSQFFICFAPQPHLNNHHSVFGQVIHGFDVLNKITQGDKITKITIEEK